MLLAGRDGVAARQQGRRQAVGPAVEGRSMSKQVDWFDPAGDPAGGEMLTAGGSSVTAQWQISQVTPWMQLGDWQFCYHLEPDVLQASFSMVGFWSICQMLPYQLEGHEGSRGSRDLKTRANSSVILHVHMCLYCFIHIHTYRLLYWSVFLPQYAHI